jgi:ClpP class serine protease
LVLFQNGENLDRESVRDIQKQLDQIVITAPEVTDIDVWIESPGGDAHAAYKLAIDLRSRCRNLRAVVPDFAKSAATLLILGMDTVFMKAAAELGPLDVQIPHPDREDVIISALDVADSLDFLARTAFGYAVSGGAVILEITGLRRSEVLIHFGF